MTFTETSIPGAFVIQGEPTTDERGSFQRLHDAELFQRQGLVGAFSQGSLSHNLKRHTLRGLHFQAPPHEEQKLVACVRGAIFDVLVDLRAGPTQWSWAAAKLSADNHQLLYAPAGVAHGYLTLEDDTSVLYYISRPFEPASARGLRWNDPALTISWPVDPAIVSARDRSWPLLDTQPPRRGGA